MSVEPTIIKQVSTIKVKTYEIHFEWTINDIEKFPWNKDRCFIRSKDLVFEEIGLKMWILFNGKRGFKYSIAEGTLKNNMAVSIWSDRLAIGPEWPDLGQFEMKSSMTHQMLIRCTVFDDECEESEISEIESDFEEVESVDTENQDDMDEEFVQTSESSDENFENVQELIQNSENSNNEVHSETETEIADEDEAGVAEIKYVYEEVVSEDLETGNQDDNDKEESQKFVQDSENKFDENNDHDRLNSLYKQAQLPPRSSSPKPTSPHHSMAPHPSGTSQTPTPEISFPAPPVTSAAPLLGTYVDRKNPQAGTIWFKYKERLSALMVLHTQLMEQNDKNLAEIEGKDFEIASKNSEIEIRVKEIASKDDEILKQQKLLEYFENIEKETDDKLEQKDEELSRIRLEMENLKMDYDNIVIEHLIQLGINRVPTNRGNRAEREDELIGRISVLEKKHADLLQENQSLTTKIEKLEATKEKSEQNTHGFSEKYQETTLKTYSDKYFEYKMRLELDKYMSLDSPSGSGKSSSP